MDQKLEQELITRFPVLFSEHGKSPQETCMYWGCSHGDGWFSILEDLCEYLTALMKRPLYIRYNDYYVKSEADNKFNVSIPAPVITFDQIKEKFATLRIYVNSNFDLPEEFLNKVDKEDLQKEHQHYWMQVNNAISYAEFLSSRRCEICGKKGKINRTGWWRTLCDEHNKSKYEL